MSLILKKQEYVYDGSAGQFQTGYKYGHADVGADRSFWCKNVWIVQPGDREDDGAKESASQWRIGLDVLFLYHALCHNKENINCRGVMFIVYETA